MARQSSEDAAGPAPPVSAFAKNRRPGGVTEAISHRCDDPSEHPDRIERLLEDRAVEARRLCPRRSEDATSEAMSHEQSTRRAT
jgi:hypothetical protein